MVKHQKEKQYQSQREHRALAQEGKKVHASRSKHLPFECCALTLNPFVNPVCNNEGILFDNDALVSHVLKHKTDPVSGKPITLKDIITLNMDKDPNTGQWQCPVLHKPFNSHSRVVAVKISPDSQANVYSYEAVQELNIKPKNYVDLLSSQKFHKQRDLIWLYDPSNTSLVEKRNMAMLTQFHQLHSGSALIDSTIKHTPTAQRVMEKLDLKNQSIDDHQHKSKRAKTARDPDHEQIYTDQGKKLKLFHADAQQASEFKYATPSLTSTSAQVTSSSQDLLRPKISPHELLQEQMQALRDYGKKAFVKLHIANIGAITLELHSDFVPRTCINFLGLAEKGLYDGSRFHRSIKHFMIQGGKPTKAAHHDDSSLWGDPFVDEFDNRLRHDKRGILSMANAGPNTNRRQFFITYRECPHLDRKHSVFGHVIQGIELLDQLEAVPTDKTDTPLESIRIEKLEVISNPLHDALEAHRNLIRSTNDERLKLEQRRKDSALGTDSSIVKVPISNKTSLSDNQSTSSAHDTAAPVGKYLPKMLLHNSIFDNDVPKSTKIRFAADTKSESDANQEMTIKPARLPAPPSQKSSFGDFSSW